MDKATALAKRCRISMWLKMTPGTSLTSGDVRPAVHFADADWFRTLAESSSQAIKHLDFNFGSAAQIGARICAFAECLSGTTKLSEQGPSWDNPMQHDGCPVGGNAVSNDGRIGCCGDADAMDSYGNVAIEAYCEGGMDNSMYVYLRVDSDPDYTANSCNWYAVE